MSTAPPKQNLLLTWLVSTLAIFLASTLLPGFEVTDFWHAALVAVVLGLINMIVKPIILLISLPLIFFTLGLFLLVINAVLLMFADELMDSLTIRGFWDAVLASLVISVVNTLFSPPRKRGGDGSQGTGGGIHIRIGNTE